MVRVSVIVSTYTKDRHSDVLRCVESLFNQTEKPDEVILVLDPVDALIEFYREIIPSKVKIVASSGFGLSNARNTGIENARGDVIAFIDDDAWADEQWLERTVENYEDDIVYGVGGKIVPVFDEGRPKWLPEELDWIVGCTYKGMPETKAEVRNPLGANMSFRREAFEIAGLFRTEVGRYGKKLLGSEETEFSMRLRRLKPDVKIVYDPSAVVYHRVPTQRSNLRYALKRAYYEGYSKAILSKEYKLSEENKYLKFLLAKSIPEKILKLNLTPLFGLLLVTICVGVGNVTGRCSVLSD